MSKKLTFLFIATFIIVLALFSSYFVVRGAVLFSNDINMGGGLIKNVLNTFQAPAPPTGYFYAVVINYLRAGDEICFKDDEVLTGSKQCVHNWCEIHDFEWCTGQDNFPGGGGCFTADTLVLMADNSYKPIREIKQEDWVLTKENETSDKMIPAKVVKTFEHTANSYLIINNQLKVTDIHPIFVNGGWKQAGVIELGDKLLNEKGEEVMVESLETNKETIKVYNLEIEDYSTYFAGGVYVHNKPSYDGPEPLPL